METLGITYIFQSFGIDSFQTAYPITVNEDDDGMLYGEYLSEDGCVYNFEKYKHNIFVVLKELN